jgi:hypothetical protein
MGIALFGIVDLFSPLHTLAERLMPGRRAGIGGGAGLRYVGVRPSCTPRQGKPAAATTAVHAPARPLRVVRRVDAQQPGRHPSRMVISGRMADVCAELDRLVALENAEALSMASPSGRLH